MADISAPVGTKNFELYRDQKLATWAIYQPRVGLITVPIYQAIGDGYGRRVTIPGATREDVIARVETFSASNARHISRTEADSVFTYGVWGTLAGGVLAAIGLWFKSKTATRIGGTTAAIGVSAGIAGKILSPRGESKEETVVVPGLNG